ncbi:MAG: chemotaxis-specific protein-glutamate methyltransferase CheB [Myxococcota bacterium]
MTRETPISVLVIDDSAANRRAITRILETAPGIRVVDRAADGEEGLRKAVELKPDVITLDLEMPRLDGYSFLRLLTARAPTPVIVLSSYRHPSDVFKALQLGAFDFVAKPQGRDAETLGSVRAELIEKVRSVRFVRRDEPAAPARPSPAKGKAPKPEAPQIIGIGASTGGPPAVQRVLESLVGLPVCVLVAQHMPARFTEAFAHRLNQALSLRVSEARSGDPIEPGRVYVAPGGEQLELAQKGSLLQLAVKRPAPTDRHAPSVDRLFVSLAQQLGPKARGVVLTGMGDDGAKGVLAMGRAGAEVWAEAESTAVVFGMPQAAIATGQVRRVLPLDELGPALAVTLRTRRP